MQREIILPQLGTKIEAATIVEWHQKAGESFKAGDLLYDVETSKTISEVEAEFSGKLIEIRLEVGDEAEVGDVLALAEVEEASR